MREFNGNDVYFDVYYGTYAEEWYVIVIDEIYCKKEEIEGTYLFFFLEFHGFFFPQKTLTRTSKFFTEGLLLLFSKLFLGFVLFWTLFLCMTLRTPFLRHKMIFPQAKNGWKKGRLKSPCSNHFFLSTNTKHNW